VTRNDTGPATLVCVAIAAGEEVPANPWDVPENSPGARFHLSRAQSPFNLVE